MRSKFDEQLALLNRELIAMGALCEEAISLAAKAMLSGDMELAAQVSPLEVEIDQKEREIESLCLKLLLHQQPVARDLRQISAALKMITDMERIGDQAADITEIIGYLQGRVDGAYNYIEAMSKATMKMVSESVDAFVKQDVTMATAVIDYDDVVDNLFDKVKLSLIEMIGNNPKDGECVLDLLMIAKYFERIGDHAVNIAEWVVFSVAGIHKGGAAL